MVLERSMNEETRCLRKKVPKLRRTDAARNPKTKILIRHNLKWTRPRLDMISNCHDPECTSYQIDIIPNGHDSEWTKFRMGTIPNMHDPESTRSRMDTISNGHDLELTRTPKYTTIPNGRHHDWA